MGSFKQFCQREPLEEGLVSAVKKIFSPKKNVSSRPQTMVTKKSDAYRTHDDIDPDDIPVFKSSLRKEDEGLTKQMKAKGYSGPKVGDDRHLTFTKKDDNKNQVLVDIPGQEWHAMKDGIVTKVGSFKSFRKRK